jgi:hypothetical protein
MCLRRGYGGVKGKGKLDRPADGIVSGTAGTQSGAGTKVVKGDGRLEEGFTVL